MNPADSSASALRYRRLFEAARDGILIVDPETRRIVDVNPFMIHRPKRYGAHARPRPARAALLRVSPRR
ncbi:PAS domain-containing protein [Horticoccus sp. 23ND18S-11]|uniref:PAS domain-containing protein n=1 Tax=Horticoccus sp. 23ND18S-11 TaxID=3391832 RepID=UPI0039C92F4C